MWPLQCLNCTFKAIRLVQEESCDHYYKFTSLFLLFFPVGFCDAIKLAVMSELHVLSLLGKYPYHVNFDNHKLDKISREADLMPYRVFLAANPGSCHVRILILVDHHLCVDV